MGRPEGASVSVVYALSDRQAIVTMTVPPQTSVAEAVAKSGLLQRFPEIGAGTLACAIFGRSVALTQPVRDGDRIEILRPLKIDPKESRRRAAGRQSRESRK